ncbi:Hypothetical predicted protein [Olea europaea subsp. europaea]|uniref:Uncharacterized protein n=1 Tax=Olea europaea subsp. europaea TaxID=158383 RepID=A0A8S0U7V5_OLEEU|nr:Hypothetical predicted protein [Olea europaea subsp. europaea]
MAGPPEQDPSGPSQARPEDSSSNDTPQGLYFNQLAEKSDLGTSVANIGESCIIDGDGSSHEASHAKSSCEIPVVDIPDFLAENGDMYLLHFDNRSNFAPLKPDFPYSSGFKSSSRDDDWMMNIMAVQSLEWTLRGTVMLGFGHGGPKFFKNLM